MIPQSRYEAVMECVKENTWPMYFYGESGRGKSSMAALVYAEWPHAIRTWQTGATDRKGNPEVISQVLPECEPIFWTAADVIQEIIDARFHNTTAKLRKQCKEAGLIVIDEISVVNETPARRSAIIDVMEWRENRPLILTGNFGPEGLQDIVDNRIIDRILQGRQIKFTGPSLRLSKLPIVEV